MPNSPVTVVIPVYNREKYIGNAIESVLSQTYSDWKMVIVNDGSTDQTDQVVQQYLSDRRIEYISFEHNRGTAETLNAALGYVTTTYFVIVDSDDWIEPNAVEVLLTEMQRQPQDTVLAYANATVWREEKGQLYKQTVQKHRSFTDKYDFMKYGSIPAPRFFRSDAVREIGGFLIDDPSHGKLAEDHYLLLRLIAIGNFYHVNEMLYHIRLHGANTSGDRTGFAEVKKYIYTKLLKEWGDEYEPTFYFTEEGWLDIKELLPKTAHGEQLVRGDRN